MFGHYWSSSPRDWWRAYGFSFSNYSGIDLDILFGWMDRWSWFSIRCFKN
jgi:hypothetical protein